MKKQEQEELKNNVLKKKDEEILKLQGIIEQQTHQLKNGERKKRSNPRTQKHPDSYPRQSPNRRDSHLTAKKSKNRNSGTETSHRKHKSQ